MVDGGHGDRGSLDCHLPKQLLQASERGHTEFFPHRLCACPIWVDQGGQMHRLALLLKLVIDAGVVASKDADANYSDVDDLGSQPWVLRWYLTA